MKCPRCKKEITDNLHGIGQNGIEFCEFVWQPGDPDRRSPKVTCHECKYWMVCDIRKLIFDSNKIPKVNGNEIHAKHLNCIFGELKG